MSYVKYPRILHLPWSEGISDDDEAMKNVGCFYNKRVIGTIKMDGESTTLYKDYFHARSIDSIHHPSQSWIKKFHGSIKHKIPKDWRICGENVYAKHTIHYKYLKSYFLVHSIWNNKNVCLSWKQTNKVAKYFNLEMVPVVYDALWYDQSIKKLYEPNFKGDECEGYVIRLNDEFHFDDFENSYAKFVALKFKEKISNVHWREAPVIPNKLRTVND